MSTEEKERIYSHDEVETIRRTAKMEGMIEFLREFTKDETQSIKYDTAIQIEAKFLALFSEPTTSEITREMMEDFADRKVQSNEFLELLNKFTLDSTYGYSAGTAQAFSKDKEVLKQKYLETHPANIDWERVIREIKNPYPESAFSPRSKEEWEEYHKVLEDHGMCGTGFSGCVGRDVWEACKHTIIEALKEELEEK